VYRGVARVATDPDAVLETMEPGDVLVAPWTAPTYNAVLAIAGAVVVQEGGLLSHAAVMARELGIPAVIGCRRAMDLIGDGGVIDVDADAGEVRLVARR
jgi:pyruvate,water dikinase